MLAPDLLEEVIAHAKASYPKEGCGFLAGRRIAERFIPMRNICGSEAEYEADPAQVAAALRSLRDSGETLIAIYHSHPRGPARPSRTDIERAYYPGAAHLIVSLAEPERPLAAAFRIVDGKVLEVEVHVIV